MKKNTIVVTGGSGFIGSALVHRLLIEGHKVRVLDNGFRGSLRRLEVVQNNIEYIEGDIRNKKIVSKACKNIDVICHLAFINGTKFFYSNPYIRQTLINSTLKFIFKLIRKSFFKL